MSTFTFKAFWREIVIIAHFVPNLPIIERLVGFRKCVRVSVSEFGFVRVMSDFRSLYVRVTLISLSTPVWAIYSTIAYWLFTILTSVHMYILYGCPSSVNRGLKIGSGLFMYTKNQGTGVSTCLPPPCHPSVSLSMVMAWHMLNRGQPTTKQCYMYILCNVFKWGLHAICSVQYKAYMICID